MTIKWLTVLLLSTGLLLVACKKKSGENHPIAVGEPLQKYSRKYLKFMSESSQAN